MSVIGGKADIREVRQLCPLMTHSGHRLVWPIPLIRHELRGLGLGVAPIHAVADLVTGFAQLPELPRSRPPVLNTWARARLHSGSKKTAQRVSLRSNESCANAIRART